MIRKMLVLVLVLGGSTYCVEDDTMVATAEYNQEKKQMTEEELEDWMAEDPKLEEVRRYIVDYHKKMAQWGRHLSN